MWKVQVKEFERSGETISVEFSRTGGTSVLVTLESVGAADPIAMARIVMTEASECSASPDEDAFSATMSEVQHSTGFTLEYRDGGAVRRLEGIDLPSLDAARAEALRSASDLVRDDVDQDQNDWAVRIRDATGEIIASVSWRQAKDAQQIDAR